MSLQELLQKIKPFYALFLVLVTASIFFAFGRLSLLNEQNSPIKIGYLAQIASSTEPKAKTGAVISSSVAIKIPKVGNTTTISPTAESGGVIGSKSGKKYYFPWCGTVKRIKPENQVLFSSAEEARMAGFVPGGNCKGLK